MDDARMNNSWKDDYNFFSPPQNANKKVNVLGCPHILDLYSKSKSWPPWASRRLSGPQFPAPSRALAGQGRANKPNASEPQLRGTLALQASHASWRPPSCRKLAGASEKGGVTPCDHPICGLICSEAGKACPHGPCYLLRRCAGPPRPQPLHAPGAGDGSRSAATTDACFASPKG